MKKNHSLYLSAVVLLLMQLSAQGQHKIAKHYSGWVVDTRNKEPLMNAEVRIGDTVLFTNTKGYFSFTDSVTDLHTLGQQIAHIGVYTMHGQQIAQFNNPIDAKQYVQQLPNAAYLLQSVFDNGNGQSTICTPQNVESRSMAQVMVGNKLKSQSQAVADTMHFSTTGYYPQKWPLRPDSTYQMLAFAYSSLAYLNTIIRPEAFSMLQGLPLMPKQSEIASVKVIYSLKSDSIYFVNTNMYLFHYSFVNQELHYNKPLEYFNFTEYTTSLERQYILASINLYKSSRTWGLEFFSGDMVTCAQIELLYNKIVKSCYFGDSLRLVVNTSRLANCANVPRITPEEINNTQRYQALNVCEGFGYLRKVKAAEMSGAQLSHHDIILLDSVPLDITPVSGIITAEFQTPLCHVNILSHNRGTPNMALRNAWTDVQFSNLENKLIYLKVAQDSFVVRAATIDEATAFWSLHDPSKPVNLVSDTSLKLLVGLDTARITDLKSIGGKASNFGELSHIQCKHSNLGNIPLPEGAFAIPFSYYAQHLKRNKIDSVIAKTLSDPLFSSDLTYRMNKLAAIQQLIKSAPIDTALLHMVTKRIANNGQSFTYYRFRSSTNTEDIEDFNGAGLYDSYTGSLTDATKPIDKAIKKVWASLWNYNAFEEREYYKINHQTVQMGILVHRSFPNELANGVIVSSIIYDRPDIQYDGVTINAQYGETSITNPVGNYTPDQIICWFINFDYNKYTIEYIGKSNVPGMNSQSVLTDAEITSLTDLCHDIQEHFSIQLHHYTNVDVEFKIDLVNGARKIYIKQARTY